MYSFCWLNFYVQNIVLIGKVFGVHFAKKKKKNTKNHFLLRQICFLSCKDTCPDFLNWLLFSWRREVLSAWNVSCYFCDHVFYYWFVDLYPSLFSSSSLVLTSYSVGELTYTAIFLTNRLRIVYFSLQQCLSLVYPGWGQKSEFLCLLVTIHVGCGVIQQWATVVLL